jgi:hypothetical protein
MVIFVGWDVVEVESRKVVYWAALTSDHVYFRLFAKDGRSK